MDNRSVVIMANGTVLQPSDRLATAYAAWIMVPITVTTLVANVLLIIVYAKFGRLRTPFAVYIVSLATGDIAQTLTLHIDSIISLLGITWPFGQEYCIFILYTCWAFLSFSYHVHVLICINRLWAVVFPTHYRLHHSRKVALILVAATLVYIHLWTLPGFIIHILHYSQSDGIPICIPSYPNELIWASPTYVALFLVPEFLVLVLYPIIFVKVRKNVHHKIQPAAGLSGSSGPGQANNGRRSSQRQSSQSGATRSRTDSKRPYNPRPHFAVLTGLVMVAVVCWTPVNTAYTLVYFRGLFLESVMTPCTVVYFLDALLDPMIFLFASREWRGALRKLLTC